MKIKKKFGFSQILAYTNIRKTTTWICYWQKQSSVMLCSVLASRNTDFIVIYLYMCQNKVIMSAILHSFAKLNFYASGFEAYRIQTQQIQNIYIIMMLQVKKSVFMILFDLFTNALIQDNRFSDIHFPHSKYYAFTCTYVTYYP